MSYLQAFVIALIQGVTELFPVSSLGHSVLVPACFLVRYFQTRTLTPFAIYCPIVWAASLLRFAA